MMITARTEGAREEVPAAVRGSVEFTSPCASTAMMRRAI